MATKSKNKINVDESMEMLKSYGFKTIIINWYTMRVIPEESIYFYDWFHTRGTVTKNKPGHCTRIQQKAYNAEDLVEIINAQVLNGYNN